MSTAKRETLEWVSLDKAKALHPQGQALIELINLLPKESKLVNFLFPSKEMKELRMTTEGRILGACRALEGDNLKKIVKRLQRIENRTIKPANPAAFLRFLSALYQSKCRSTFLPLQLDLNDKGVTPLRSSKYLGHPDLPFKAWAAMTLLGHPLLECLLNTEDNKRVRDDLRYLISKNTESRATGLNTLLSLASDYNLSPTFTEDPAFLDAIQETLCSYPATSNTDFVTRMYLTHLFDFTPTSASDAKNSPRLNAHDPHQLFFFTDGTRVYLKIGVFVPPSMKSATKFVFVDRIFNPENDAEPSDNNDTWYAMYNVLTGEPALFNFKQFVPAGQPLPKKDGSWFTVATFNTKGAVNDVSRINLKTLRKTFPNTLPDKNHLLLDPDLYPDWVLPLDSGRSSSDDDDDDDDDNDTTVPGALQLHHVYCEQVPELSLYKILMSLSDTVYSQLLVHPSHQPGETTAYQTVSNPRHTTVLTENRLTDYHLLRQTYFSASVYGAVPRRDDTRVTPTLLAPLFTAMYKGSSFTNETPPWPSGLTENSTRFDRTASAQSCIWFTMTGRAQHKTEPLMDPKGHPKDLPLLPFFTNDKQALSKYFDDNQLSKLNNFGPLAMAGSSVMVALSADAEVFQRESYENLITDTLSSHIFVVTTPLAGLLNGSSSIATTPLTSLRALPSIIKMKSLSSPVFGMKMSPIFIRPATPRSAPAPYDVRLNGLCVPTVTSNMPHAVNVFRIFLSPLSISEGVIHIHPSLNLLGWLHKWMPRLLELNEKVSEVETHMIQLTSDVVKTYAVSTVSRKFAKDFAKDSAKDPAKDFATDSAKDAASSAVASNSLNTAQ